MKWEKVNTAYRAEVSATSSHYLIARFIRRGGAVRFVLYVEGERYGGEGLLRDKKNVAEYLQSQREARVK